MTTKIKRLLSEPKSRAELIASMPFGLTAAAEADVSPETTTDPPLSGDGSDPSVDDAIQALEAAIEEAITAQAADPDEATDPNDKPVNDDLTKIKALLEDLKTAQAKDEANDPAPTDAPSDSTTQGESIAEDGATSTKLAAAPATDAVDETDSQVDENGNVDPTVKCSTPDCQHMASAHADLDSGENSGACGMQGCNCEAMTIDTKQLQQAQDEDGGGVNNDGGDGVGDNTPGDPTATASMADPAVPADAPSVLPDAPTTEANLPPEMSGGDSMGPAFTIPVAIILGQDTGDGRSLAKDSLDWRVPPLPLMGLATATHDPMGMDMNDPAVICGRIDSLEYAPGEGDTQVVVAKGYYLPNDDGMYFAELNEAMGRMGVSADIAVIDSTMEGEFDEDGWPTMTSETVIKGTIMALTICPEPAFQGAYIVLGDGTEQPEAIPQAAEQTPESVAAAGIHWMAFEECLPCAQGLEIIVASGAGPERPPMAWFENPGFHVGDDRLREIAPTRGNYSNAKKYACPLTVTEDGQIFGHIAPWGVCHTGSSGECIMAPHSQVGYAHFLRGSVLSAEGEMIRTGVVTADTGHASTRPGVSPAAAMAHYDNTGWQAADVTMGEDDFGVWVAGAIRPDATDAQIRMLRASSYSGDWRNMGGGLEMVALLAVNQPGFPVATVASGKIETLVASGSATMFALQKEKIEEQLDDPNMDVALRLALAPLLAQMKVASMGRVHKLSLANARRRISALN